MNKTKIVYLALDDGLKSGEFFKVRNWIYLSNNYDIYSRLSKSLPGHIKISNMMGEFEKRYEQIKFELLNGLSEFIRNNNSLAWWSGQVASHTSTGSNIVRNIVYLTYAVDQIRKNKESTLIICPDKGTMACLDRYCKKNDIDCRYASSKITNYNLKIRNLIRIVVNVWGFIYDYIKYKINIKSLPVPDLTDGKKVIIRSWLTGDTLSDDERRYKDRNFGYLNEYLSHKGYHCIFIPLIFNTGLRVKDQFRLMASVNVNFLLPHHLLGMGDCFRVIMYEIKRLFISFNNFNVYGVNAADIINHEILRTSFSRSLMSYNLIYPLICKLKKMGVDIGYLIYPFENNAPEKLFILAKKHFYPGSVLSGFQHTVITSNQLGMELAPNEYQHYPLPDRIICSGTIWEKKLVQNNFPKNILKKGPSLRFAHIRNYHEEPNKMRQPILSFFMALPYSQNLSYELMEKVNEASQNFHCYVNVKPHPLLNKSKLIQFISGLERHRFKLVEGTPYKWFKSSDIAFEIGSSVTQLEAVGSGIPVVRIVPDNFFNFDPMDWLDYPIRPSKTVTDIIENIHKALQIEPDEFKRRSEKVREVCFTEISYSAMDSFIP